MSTPRHSWKTFLHYVIPSVSAMVLFSAYTIVDGIFVSKGVGELALAGVNIALPFINVLSGTAILLSMGTSTLCAFALGHGDHEKAEKSSPRRWWPSWPSPR
ncbi:MAG: MATE family efflux transporter [Evtepia gabavorous]